MRGARLWAAAVVVFVAACQAAPVEVRAAPAPDGGVFVRFARDAGGPPEHRARVEATGGRILDEVQSPDRRSVAVHWSEPSGVLDCRFPYNSGEGRFEAGGPVDARSIRYVFLERNGVRISGTVPRGCPIVARVRLEVLLDEALLPATLLLPGPVAVPLRETRSRVTLPLPRDEHGGLEEGDLLLVLKTASAPSVPFVIAVDRDGVVAAVSGYLETGKRG